MAGYIFTIGDIESFYFYAKKGVYSTILSEPKKRWLPHHESTLADYASMQAGDNVYFFTQRKIYGIGKLVNLEKKDCKFQNYPSAYIWGLSEVEPEQMLLYEDEYSINQRWVCTFVPDPYFFTEGIDMDDLLASNPNAFKMLRVLSNLSFIKFDDEENQAFRDALLLSNKEALRHPIVDQNVFGKELLHVEISHKLVHGNYNLNVGNVVDFCSGDGRIGHESAMEAAFVYQLANKHPATKKVFGKWDYISHQVVASPFKPIVYVDKMDVFGYSYLPGFKPTKAKYLIAELKKNEALIEDISQVMKYVDWVNEEYSKDYSMIKAYLVAYDFDASVIAFKKENSRRQYTKGRRPARDLKWSDLTLVRYRYDSDSQEMRFSIVKNQESEE